MNIVIGFSGAIGSGKTHLSRAVAHAFGWKFASFGNYIRLVAQKQGIDPLNIPALQNIGQDLVEHHLDELCQAVLKQSGWIQGDSLVIDGIRHVEVSATLRSTVCPTIFRLVFVQTALEVRIARIKKRVFNGNMFAVDLEVLDNHRSEIQVARSLEGIADLTVSGAIDPDHATKQVLDWVDAQLAAN